MKATVALAEYQENKNTLIQDLDNHKIVSLLLEGAIEKLNIAKSAISKGEIAKKGESISLAISIIDALQTSVDRKTGEIGENLYALYDYMMQTLLQANLNSDESKLDEVLGLLKEIQAGWNQIREEAVKALEALKDQS